MLLGSNISTFFIVQHT